MISREQKQIEIEQIVKEIVESDFDYIGISEETKISNIDQLLCRLTNVFLNSESFRPHYYFIFDLLDKKSWQDLTNPLGFIKSIEEFLNSSHHLKHNDEYKGIHHYFCDNEFKHSVNMFISAIKYELMVRKGISKSDQEITAQQNALSEFLKAPKNLLNKQIEEYNSTLDKYTSDFNKKLEDAESKLSEAISTYESAKNQYESTTDEIRKTREEMSSLTTNILTILGVFVSIIFIIVGAYFTVTGEVFNKSISDIVQINLGRFILMGHILINILFLFMFMISRLSGKNISVMCNGCKNSRCTNNQCSFLKRIVKKYPYVIYSNIIITGAYIALLGWWLIESFAYEPIKTFFVNFASNHTCMFILIIIASVFLLIFTPILFFMSRFSKPTPTIKKD